MSGEAWFHVTYLDEDWEEVEDMTVEDLRASELLEFVGTWISVHKHRLLRVDGRPGLDRVYHLEIEVTHEE